MHHGSQHIIGKLNLDLNLPGSSYDQPLVDQFRDAAIDAINHVLEDFPGNGSNVISIDRIDLDLELPDAAVFTEALEEQLRIRIMEIFKVQRSQNVHDKSDAIIQSVEDHTWSSLLFYLLHGYLPWNNVPGATLDENLLTKVIKADLSKINELRQCCFSERALERLCFEMSVEVADAIIRHQEVELMKIADQLDQKIQLLSAGLGVSISTARRDTSEQRRIILWITIRNGWLAPVASDQRPLDTMIIESIYLLREKVSFAEHLWNALSEEVHRYLKQLAQNKGKQLAAVKASQSKDQVLSEAIYLFIAGKIKFGLSNKEKQLIKSFVRSDCQSELDTGNEESTLHDIGRTESTEQANKVRINENSEKSRVDEERVSHEDSSGIYIPNAGIVILHPFLLPLFQELGISDHQEFRSSIKRQHAVLLIHTLAGLDPAMKAEFALNKLLCGLDVQEVVFEQIDNAWGWEKECQELLHSVVQHWKALKKTSVEALQESFLQREGLLKSTERYHKLQVEKKPYDVLLDGLPWPISRIQLPWMERPLIVDWY